MKRWTIHALAISIVVLLAAGCSSAPNRADTIMPAGEGGSTLVGNPASLKAQNLAVAVKIIQQPTANIAPAAGPVVAGQFTLTWDPPPTPPVAYRVERKIGAGGAWAAIADVSASVRSATDIGELGATHTFRVVSFDAAGNSGVSDEVSARIPTFCDYPSGWSMVWPVHGCAPFESTFALDAKTVYFAGPKLIVREEDEGALPTYRTIDIGTDAVLNDVCAIDRDHVFAVGYAQAPREKARGAAIAVVGGIAKRIDLAGIERGPLLRIFCDSPETFSAVGTRGTALRCSPAACTPIDGIDNPREERPYAAIWGIPSQGIITGASVDSLALAKPGAPPEPLLFQQPEEHRQTRAPAIIDLWGVGGGVTRSKLDGFFAAADDGLYRFHEGALTKIDDGRYRRLWGSKLDDVYAVGDGISRYRFPLDIGIVRNRNTHSWEITPSAGGSRPFQKTTEGPPLTFTAIHGSNPLRFYLTDSTGQIFEGDETGSYTSLLNIWRGELPQSHIPFDRKHDHQEITAIAPAGEGQLAISLRGADEGVLLFSPAENSIRPLPEFRETDVHALALAGDRLVIASSKGLYAAQAGDFKQRPKKLADGVFSSAWDCGAGGVCAVRSKLDFSPDDIVLLRPQEGAEAKQIASPYGLRKFRQAGGGPENGFFAIVRSIRDGFTEDELVSYDGRDWRKERLPDPPPGVEEVALRIVSAPGEKPILLAASSTGREISYVLIAPQNGRWAEIDRGDHLRALVQVTPTGERILGIPELPFKTTALVSVGDDLWAIADGTFLFRKGK